MYKKAQNIKNQKGTVVTYILAAIFLSGLLVAVLSQGSKKSADSLQIERAVSFLKTDIESIHYAIAECVQIYPNRVDINNDNVKDENDNPNAPFPLYEDLSYGEAGENFKNIKCPAAPLSNNSIFGKDLYNSIKLVSDDTSYNVRYFNNVTEGVYIRISATNSDVIWQESISRINDIMSECAVEIISDSGDCEGQCLYYWLSRLSTSTLGNEPNCP